MQIYLQFLVDSIDTQLSMRAYRTVFRNKKGAGFRWFESGKLTKSCTNMRAADDGGYGLEGNILRGWLMFESFLLSCFEFAVDGNVGILIEAGIGFETWFGLGSAFDYTEIMAEETYTPFKGCEGVIMLEGMSEFLGRFDEITVSYAGSRPSLGKMVRIELKKVSSTARNTADDDVFLVAECFFDGIP